MRCEYENKNSNKNYIKHFGERTREPKELGDVGRINARTQLRTEFD